MLDYQGLLHRHPGLERRLGLDSRHVIVDQPDWRQLRNWLDNLPLSADGRYLIPGEQAFSLGNDGEMYPVIVEMVGTQKAGLIQVRHANSTDGIWLEAASELYVSPMEAARRARQFRASREAYLADKD